MTPTQFKKTRLKLNMNTTQLASALGCVERHVRRMEAGERAITPDTIEKMNHLADEKGRG